MMTLPITRHTPASVGHRGQCNFRHHDKKECAVRCNGLTQDQSATSKLHPQLHYILDARHNDLPNKILYIVCAANSVKVNPIVYTRMASIQSKY